MMKNKFSIHDFDSVNEWVEEEIARANKGADLYETPGDNTIRGWCAEAYEISESIRYYVGYAQLKQYGSLIHDLEVGHIRAMLRAWMDGCTRGFLKRSMSAEQAHHQWVGALVGGIISVNKDGDKKDE